MTVGRAALLAMLGSYVRLSQREEPAAEEGASLLGIQKLMYFLQERGQPLRLNYVKARLVLTFLAGYQPLSFYPERSGLTLPLAPLSLRGLLPYQTNQTTLERNGSRLPTRTGA